MGGMIIHVDMDAFYASVEERENPSLVGKPVIVGGTAEGRGVVAAANYEARKFGVHSAMASATAHRLCPHAIVIRPRIDFYAEVSHRIREIFEQFTPLVEPLSLDEAFLDVTGSAALFGSSVEIARQVKQRIRDQLKLIASVGVAPNKFLAKIASDVNKPDGFLVVEPDHVNAFLAPLPVGRIWGVGKVTGRTFDQLGIRTIGQLQTMSVEALSDLFGASGEHYWRLARGLDDRTVVPDREAKSISHETTFAEDIREPELLQAWLVELVEQVGRRMRRHELRGRTVEIKVRFSDFQTVTRSNTLPAPSNVTNELYRAGLELLTTKLPPRHLPVRLLGFGVKNLDATGIAQRQLFDEPDRARHRQIDRVADEIAAKFGGKGLRRGLRPEDAAE
jgi:DNA polymerase-4